MKHNFDWHDIMEEVVIEEGSFTLKVKIANDEYVPNPLEEWDGVGMIHSFSTRHINNISPDDVDKLKEKHGVAVPLSYFEHGMCQWSVGGTMSNMPDFRWDGVGYAGVWVPDEYIQPPEEMKGDELQEWWEEQAQAACDVYTQWANGEVYWYRMELTQTIGGWTRTVWEDSCGGFFGSDYICQHLNDMMADVNEAIKENSSTKLEVTR